MHLILFEDDLVAQLHPATIGRPAFELSCGGYRLAELAGRLGDTANAVGRPHLREMLSVDAADTGIGLCEDIGDVPDGQTVLLVNARIVPAVSSIEQIRSLAREGRTGTVLCNGHVAAAVLGAEQTAAWRELAVEEWIARLSTLPLLPIEGELPLLEYPHDLLRYHRAALEENLEDRLARGDYAEIADGVFAAPSANLGPYAVTDTTDGPIVLEEDAQIGPYCYLSGPVHIGPRSRVIEHAAIKDGVALGHTVKIGGEIEASIVEPYTNKQHHGFLGHSYLGSWVNLGAGTCNSDLKNTYGQVSMEYEGRKVATGMQFIGCIVGDYAKTAINSSVFTGKTIGACAMVYGFVTTNVPSFVNYARSFGQVTEVPVDVMIATQARMFARRGVPQRPCDVQLLRDAYALTQHERQLATEPLSL